MTNEIASMTIYNFNLDPYAAGVVGALLVQKIMDVVKDRFPNLSETALFAIGWVAGCCVVAGAYYAATPTLIVTSIALIALRLGVVNPLSPSLPPFLCNMNAQAKNKPFKKYIGIEKTIQQLEAVLRRGEVTNSILVGPPGVGKTAVIETLVQKIVDNDLPDGSAFQGKKICRLSMKDFLGGGDTLLGGTQFRGQLATRVQALVKACQEDPSIIIFMDEIHLIKGKTAWLPPSEEIGELLKDCLDRNELKIIGATTDKEYRAFIAPDGPLTRRFNKIAMVPPDPKTCVRMIQAQKETFTQRYGTRLTDEAIAAAVVFATAYHSDKALPYSAVNILETVCSSYDRPPASIEPNHIASLYPRINSLPYLQQHYPALLQNDEPEPHR